MVRTTIIPDNANIILSIPKDYIGREVEVIAFAKEEGFYQPVKSKKEDLQDNQLIEKSLRIINPYQL